MLFPEIDALARAAAGDVPDRPPDRRAGALGCGRHQRAAAALLALRRWTQDCRAPPAERDHAAQRLAGLAG
jgi:hypothetical protein